MKKQRTSRLIKFSFLFLISVFAVQAQEKTSVKNETRQENNLQNTNDNASPEVKVIEYAYKKMTIAHMAQRLNQSRRNGKAYDHEKTLKFKLKNFHTGPIEEIENTVVKDLVTDPGEGIIDVETIKTTNRSIDKNGVAVVGEPQFSIDAKWKQGKYASGNDPQWTVGDILQFEAARYSDIGKYTSYDVEVSLDGKKRVYQALAFFHNPYQSQNSETLAPEFLDSVAGFGGTITQVFKERKMPLGTKLVPKNQSANLTAGSIESAKHRGEKPSTVNNTLNLMCPADFCGGGCLEWYYTPIDPSYTYCMTFDVYYTGGGGDGGYSGCRTKLVSQGIVPQADKDSTAHNEGNHTAASYFEARCIRTPQCDVYCEAVALSNDNTEDDEGRSSYYYHVPKRAVETETGSGQLNQEVSCRAAVGHVFKYCFFKDCSFDVSVSVYGTITVTPSGNEVWQRTFAHSGNCNMNRN